MRSVYLNIIAGALLAAVSLVATGTPAHVMVRAKEQGQGLLFKRYDQCYLLTAGHVIAGGKLASIIGGGSRPLLGQAELVAQFAEYDLSLMRASGAVTRDCAADLHDLATSLDPVLSRQADGVLTYVYDDGSLGRTQVVNVDTGPKQLRVATSTRADAIAQGQSGSLVKVAGTPVGILLAVEESGEGRVLRLDVAARLIEDFFRNPSVESLHDISPKQQQSSPSYKTGNLLDAKYGARVVAWNALPDRPDLDAKNLVIGVADQPWVGERGSRPVDIDFVLNDNKAHTVSRIELVQAMTEPAGRRVKDFEVLVGRDGRSWTSVTFGTLIASEEMRVIPIAPVRTSMLRVRIHSNWGDAKRVSLRSVSAF